MSFCRRINVKFEYLSRSKVGGVEEDERSTVDVEGERK